ncbi:MAG: folylpolyglutamate synthase/dihydrofolate synthase family protein [bacterium]
MNKNLKLDIYQYSTDILTSQGRFYISLGLERVQAILELMQNPEKKLKFIHVAGTNGKGSVCAMLSAILSHQPNFQVGLFTSPHVFEYTERIKINDVEIDKTIFAQKIIKITELAQKHNIYLTEFEILTVVAFEYFAENNVDVVILETGLGGRLDSTNVIEENICSIITHIDFDHTERLGDTIEKIAFEKAGIVKKNCPVVISENSAGFEIIKKIAEEKNSPVVLPLPPRERTEVRGFNVAEDCVCHSFNNKLDDKGFTLQGTYQSQNLALVLKAVEILNQNGFNILQENIKQGLKNVKHPCRFEFFEDENILVDGAHNPNGTKVLRESLDVYFPNQRVNFVFGCLKNKNYAEMMRNLFTPKDDIYFFHFDSPNACSYEELAEACKFTSKPFSEYKKDKSILTVICGSFYMIKEVSRLLRFPYNSDKW